MNNKPFQAKLKQKYDKIFVSCKHSKLPEGFNRINPLSEFNSGYLSGPMALGRVLQILMKDYGKFNCIIDGYDFYLDSCPYNDNYSSSLRMSNGFFNDRMISWTLTDHDALYNFLLIKKIVSKLRINNSSSFNDIIDMSGNEYMEKLFKVVDFSKL